jgi:hypothetical protein
MELDALPPGKAARSARITIRRFWKFSAHYSPQVWRSIGNLTLWLPLSKSRMEILSQAHGLRNECK